jgi:hypothetical protein
MSSFKLIFRLLCGIVHSFNTLPYIIERETICKLYTVLINIFILLLTKCMDSGQMISSWFGQNSLQIEDHIVTDMWLAVYIAIQY